MGGERILLVEDERAVARGLTVGLQQAGFHVDWAASGQQALMLAGQRAPDLILLDLRLPDISGFDVCRQLRATGHREPILMVTALDDEVDRILGLEIGADDYVVKPYSLRELISRVRAQLRRAYGDLALQGKAAVVRFGDAEVDFDRFQVTRSGQPVSLTPTEMKLLRFLVSRAGRPCTREAIIEEVWGYTPDLGSSRAVDVHVRHLRQKLELNPEEPQHLVTVRGVGYRFQQ